MNRHQKLIEKFKRKQPGLTYPELKSLLTKLGYKEQNRGKTSGSKVAFFSPSFSLTIRLHKPHPRNELKIYQINYIYNTLLSNGHFK